MLFRSVGGQAGPFAEGEVDQVVDALDVRGNEVDTPETKLG